MLSLAYVRKYAEAVDNGIKAKGESVDLSTLLNVDTEHRRTQTEINDLRAERNRVSDEIARVKLAGGDTADAIAAMRIVGDRIKTLEKRVDELAITLKSQLSLLPNIPHESVPIGNSPEDNKVVREWGTKPEFDYKIKDHVALGSALGLFDFERAANISGSGFPLYTNQGAKLERGLINFMLDFHAREHGYTEISPPLLSRAAGLFTCGQLPKFAEDMYRTENDELYLIPTAEVPLTNMHKDEIIDGGKLPINYTAFTACFRREAGSYGKETRGLLRVHQFNKVEMVKFVQPETAYEELEKLVTNAEAILQALGIHYRVVELCTGDLSFAAAKCYDLEAWSPAAEQWLEVSSCSNFADFQARRGNIRYRRAIDQRVDFVHTLNGSGLATPRVLIALLESYQTPDRQVIVPDALQPYVGVEVLG